MFTYHILTRLVAGHNDHFGKVEVVAGCRLSDGSREIVFAEEYAKTSVQQAGLAALYNVFNNARMRSLEEVRIVVSEHYLHKGVTAWMARWALNRWKTSKGDDVKNKETWQKILTLSAEFKLVDMVLETPLIEGTRAARDYVDKLSHADRQDFQATHELLLGTLDEEEYEAGVLLSSTEVEEEDAFVAPVVERELDAAYGGW